MSLQRKIIERKNRRKQRVRKKIRTGTTPRLSVFRSSKHIYAQIIDDAQHKTLVSFSTLALDEKTGDKKGQAKIIGKELAKQAKKQGIEAVGFDRGKYLYHGRLKAFAEGFREGGLTL